MFGLFKTEDFQHPTLGVFRWVRACWRGEMALPNGTVVPLIVGGTRKGPDHAALRYAENVGSDLRSVESQLMQELFEHYEPYAEAARNGEIEASGLPQLRNGSEALRIAEVEAIVVVELDGALATEVCYRVPWDEEHTLGARFRGTNWVELCGSTLVP
ncbi:DUF6985 domain-containing protein [Piscinibacter sakaiensis]|uniref:DUF6985 domain-containing protein n=1 Tax=Piscinibacter sakaiensis TaxID=1547922 RepID=UPI00372D8453